MKVRTFNDIKVLPEHMVLLLVTMVTVIVFNNSDSRLSSWLKSWPYLFYNVKLFIPCSYIMFHLQDHSEATTEIWRLLILSDNDNSKMSWLTILSRYVKVDHNIPLYKYSNPHSSFCFKCFTQSIVLCSLQDP